MEPSQSLTCPSSRNFNFKIVLLGEGCVGKTSMVLRYCEDSFSDKHHSTVQASFMQKKINLSGRRIQLAIWDTAGQERFHSLGPIYYRDSNGAILVYDITDVDSFVKVKNWVKELRKMLGSEICLSIAGNKTDLEKQRTVDAQEAEQYAALVGAKHFHTSAKLNNNIEELFIDLSERMIQSTELSQSSQVGPNKALRRNIVVVEQDNSLPSPSNKTCCG